MESKIFKAYDIRGIYPGEIDEKDMYKIATAYCQYLKPKEVVIGCDVRQSSPSLKKAAIKAVTDQGIKVIDVGEISTDMLYFSVANYGYSGGFTITASHNPAEYNGAKFVREESKPISGDTGLFEIRDMAEKITDSKVNLEGEINEELIEKKDVLIDYVEKVKSFADFSKIKPFKIVINANFGFAGKIAEKILEETSIELIKLNCEPDGTFPKGRPDPLIPENRKELSELIRSEKADLGVAWDADADRCFFFTEKGEFIEGYFITAILAKIFLENKSDETIIHDTRLTWAINDLVAKLGGKSVSTKAGHSFIKERMRKEKAIFGGEMSAHYYFKDYYYCDNGMIPMVMMLEMLSSKNKKPSELMTEMFWQNYFVSGEINLTINDAQAVIQNIKEKYEKNATNKDEQDGISLDFVNNDDDKKSWRFSLRGSNTEPLIRLNVEAKSQKMMEEKRDELLELIQK